MGFLVHKGFGWGDVGENNLRVIESYSQLTMPAYLIRPKKRLSNPVVDKFADFIIANISNVF